MHGASGYVRREGKGCICLRGSEKGEEEDVNSLCTAYLACELILYIYICFSFSRNRIRLPKLVSPEAFFFFNLGK